MRRLATALLVACAGLFVAAHHFAAASPAWAHPVWQWVLAFSEAAMVGGLADWFAVTALFRHPLGLPIPHTAIIPANRDRIADNMARFLSTHFLVPGVVARRMAAVNLAGAAGAWLSAPGGGAEARLRHGAGTLGADLLEALDGDRQLGRLARRALAQRLDALDLAPLLGAMLSRAIAEGRHRPLLEAAFHRIGTLLEDNEATLRGMIHERANAIMRWTGVDERIANAVLDGLYRLLAEMIVDPAHPLRLRLDTALERLAHDLVEDEAMRARVQRFKAEMLANPELGTWLDGLWEGARARLLGLARGQGQTPVGSGSALASLGAALSGNAEVQALANRLARRVIAGTASRHAATIVTLVSETVKRWDTRTVSARIEAAVGRDLQFIRINGTLVGGLVGLALHAMGRLL